MHPYVVQVCPGVLPTHCGWSRMCIWGSSASILIICSVIREASVNHSLFKHSPSLNPMISKRSLAVTICGTVTYIQGGSMEVYASKQNVK